ncbi:MAG: hypothetical protein L7V86_20080 [Verrucomicrobiales bacterium]|jgi:hypothetical protein|nr:hypothetical protein [Verrucomicrobiales bacterium]MDB4467727.1 hypothetical protein [Verrucomicrobiales bacterium]
MRAATWPVGSHPFPFLQGTPVNYNRDLEASLPEFLAEVDDLDTRFFLELLFKSQADNKEEGATPEKERTVRLHEFLPQLAEHLITQHRHLRRCLTLTQQEPLRFRAELTPMIDRAVKISISPQCFKSKTAPSSVNGLTSSVFGSPTTPL